MQTPSQMQRTRSQDLVPDSNENGITMTSLSGPERGDKMITVKELFLEPGAEIPVHLHPDVEETHFLIKGELTSILGNNEFTMNSRDCMLAPAGMPHGMKNNSNETGLGERSRVYYRPNTPKHQGNKSDQEATRYIKKK